MPKLLSLKELAAICGKSPKTLKKTVIEKGVPYYAVGASMMFDEAEAKLYLRTIPEPVKTVVKFAPRKRKGQVASKFAEAVGV